MHATKEQIKLLGRLKKRSDFLHAQYNGVRWNSPSVIIQLVFNSPTTNKETPRFGVTATRKTGNAVQRARIKRRLRSAMNDIFSSQKLNLIQDGLNIVLIGRKETLDVPYSQLCKDLRWCLKRLLMKIEEEKD